MQSSEAPHRSEDLDAVSDRYFLLMFLMEFERGNILGHVYRDPGSDTWVMPVRFRYYMDNKVFESDDVKHQYVVSSEPGETAKDARAMAKEVVDLGPRLDAMADVPGVDLGHHLRSRTFDVDGRADKFVEVMQSCDACHFRKDTR